MENQTIAKVIFVILVFTAGLLSGWYVWPEEIVTEKIVEVEKIEKQPAQHQDIYNYCANKASSILYSSWDGKPKEGTTPKNTQDFVAECFTKLTPQHN